MSHSHTSKMKDRLTGVIHPAELNSPMSLSHLVMENLDFNIEFLYVSIEVN